MDLATAQDRLVTAYANGATGVLMSGLVWVVAGVFHITSGQGPAFWALFFGGMLIQPGAMLLARLVPGTSRPIPGNPLDRLAVESLAVLFGGLFLGYLLLRQAPSLAFPAIAMAVGARYFLFRTLYREPLFWGFGAAVMGLAGAVALGLPYPRGSLVLLVGLVELMAAILLLMRWRKIRA